jgi:hypothetical protein
MIIFRHLKYAVYHMKTERTPNPYTGRWTHRRVRNGKPEWRDRKYLHAFLEDGTDSVGQRWKSLCGRFRHEAVRMQTPEDIAWGIKAFLRDPYRCSICLEWILKNKDSVMTAERLNG